jgi:hypothetical protein
MEQTNNTDLNVTRCEIPLGCYPLPGCSGYGNVFDFEHLHVMKHTQICLGSLFRNALCLLISGIVIRSMGSMTNMRFSKSSVSTSAAPSGGGVTLIIAMLYST